MMNRQRNVVAINPLVVMIKENEQSMFRRSGNLPTYTLQHNRFRQVGVIDSKRLRIRRHQNRTIRARVKDERHIAREVEPWQENS